VAETRKSTRGAKRHFYRDDNMTFEEFWKRWEEVLRLADLRPTDRVLDVGCAEGWNTFELAKLVAHAHGFDNSDVRIAEAQRLAAEQGIENVSFEVASVSGYEIEPLSYDVTLFSGVWGARGVGVPEVENLLTGTRRQFIARIKLTESPDLLEQLLEACDRNDFDAMAIPRKMLLAHRRGVEVRLPAMPGAAIVPISWLADHPFVQGISVGTPV
jgi:SAM-dependent methyltransferase